MSQRIAISEASPTRPRKQGDIAEKGTLEDTLVAVKTLANESDLSTLANRIASVTAQDTARWGRMNAYQMMRHLADALRVPLGEKRVSEQSGLFQRTLMKWGALWFPTPWPKSVPTRPEIDQCLLGVCDGDFEASRKDALQQLARLSHAKVEGARHPYFGAINQKEWMRWAWLHTDHHLRQFGR